MKIKFIYIDKKLIPKIEEFEGTKEELKYLFDLSFFIQEGGFEDD